MIFMSFCPKSIMSLCLPKYVFMSTNLYVFLSQTFMSFCPTRKQIGRNWSAKWAKLLTNFAHFALR